MAQKKSSSASRSSGAKKSGSGKSKSNVQRPPETAPTPIRREVAGVVFLVLSVFVLISFFNEEGEFIRFFAEFFKGMIGYGYWACAPAFLLCAGILFTHRGRPVVFRVVSALLLPILFGALVHLFVYITPITDSLEQLTGLLFEEGQKMQSGGAVSGLLAYGLQRSVSVWGALLVLGAAFIFFLLRSLNTTLLRVMQAERQRERPQYNPADYADQPTLRDLAASRTARVQQTVQPAARQPQKQTVPLQQKQGFLPFDDSDSSAPISPIGTSKNARTAQRARKTTAAPVYSSLDIPMGDEEEALQPFGSTGTANKSRSVGSTASVPIQRAQPSERIAEEPERITPLQNLEQQETPKAQPVSYVQPAVRSSSTVQPQARRSKQVTSTAAYVPPVSEPVKAEVTPVISTAAVSPAIAETPTVVKPSATEGVRPLSESEAARMAGVSLEKPETEAPAKPKTDGRKVTAVKRTERIDVEKESADVAAEIAARAAENPTAEDYVFPPTNLLRASQAASRTDLDEIEQTKQNLEKALSSFGVPAPVVNIINGPTVTRYDIRLREGVKLARVTNLAGDIALSLGVINVRIAPVPDEISTVGIEVPNKIVTTVYLRDIIESKAFTSAKSKLTFSLGKDIGGNAMVGNISKLPHLLIAGTTGSGKSVCMNSLILSILYKARPDEVKFIMVDPKMVELGIYNGIPHLYVPVVTDPQKAAGALKWSVVEMLKRYRLFSEDGVRDLDAYNAHRAANGEEQLPRVVVVIDELADLMMVAAKDVEESICRVAQMGRAAGMHLVVATQRPSADVITGLMKANIPSRIAFAVSSSLESRIILDQVGAEKLVGMGDMLYSPVGIGKPARIQGAFVSDEEREEIITFIKENAGVGETNHEIADFMNKTADAKNAEASGGKNSSAAANDSPAGDYDEMLPQAVEVVMEAKQCSVSMLQRRLKLGYSRAARVVDQLEELGIVGPYEGAKPRSVVMDRNGWNELQVKLGYASADDFALAAEISESTESNTAETAEE